MLKSMTMPCGRWVVASLLLLTPPLLQRAGRKRASATLPHVLCKMKASCEVQSQLTPALRDLLFTFSFQTCAPP
jgi:hypothetical protein